MERSYIEVGFPFQIDGRGRVADPDYDEHVRQMIELVLFTAPGERVNRPDFGCGLMQKVFDPNSPTFAGNVQILVRNALRKWLGEVITVEQVEVEARDSTLAISIEYLLIDDGSRRVATFEPRQVLWPI